MTEETEQAGQPELELVVEQSGGTLSISHYMGRSLSKVVAKVAEISGATMASINDLTIRSKGGGTTNYLYLRGTGIDSYEGLHYIVAPDGTVRTFALPSNSSYQREAGVMERVKKPSRWSLWRRQRRHNEPVRAEPQHQGLGQKEASFLIVIDPGLRMEDAYDKLAELGLGQLQVQCRVNPTLLPYIRSVLEKEVGYQAPLQPNA